MLLLVVIIVWLLILLLFFHLSFLEFANDAVDDDYAVASPLSIHCCMALSKLLVR